MDEVEDFAQVASEPVEGVHDDGVAGTGVGEQVGQAGAVGGGSALLVRVDPCLGDARCAEGVELAFQALFGGGDPGVPEFESHGRTVPEVVSVRPFWNTSCGTACGTTGVAITPGRGFLTIRQATCSASKDVERLR